MHGLNLLGAPANNSWPARPDTASDEGPREGRPAEGLRAMIPLKELGWWTNVLYKMILSLDSYALSSSTGSGQQSGNSVHTEW